MHNNISDGAEKPEGDEKVALSTAKPSASGDTLPLPAMYCTRPDLYTMGTAEKEHAEPEREIPFMLVPGVTTDEKLAAIGIYRSGVPDDEQVRNVSGRKSLCVDEAANTAVEDGHVPPLEMANATCLAITFGGTTPCHSTRPRQTPVKPPERNLSLAFHGDDDLLPVHLPVCHHAHELIKLIPNRGEGVDPIVVVVVSHMFSSIKKSATNIDGDEAETLSATKSMTAGAITGSTSHPHALPLVVTVKDVITLALSCENSEGTTDDGKAYGTQASRRVKLRPPEVTDNSGESITAVPYAGDTKVDASYQFPYQKDGSKTTLTWLATDSGNAKSCTVTVTVKDVIKPALSCDKIWPIELHAQLEESVCHVLQSVLSPHHTQPAPPMSSPMFAAMISLVLVSITDADYVYFTAQPLRSGRRRPPLLTNSKTNSARWSRRPPCMATSQITTRQGEAASIVTTTITTPLEKATVAENASELIVTIFNVTCCSIIATPTTEHYHTSKLTQPPIKPPPAIMASNFFLSDFRPDTLRVQHFGRGIIVNKPRVDGRLSGDTCSDPFPNPGSLYDTPYIMQTVCILHGGVCIIIYQMVPRSQKGTRRWR